MCVKNARVRTDVFWQNETPVPLLHILCYIIKLIYDLPLKSNKSYYSLHFCILQNKPCS